MKKTRVPTKSGRLLDAVAAMGYEAEVALCDLLDNSVDAGATIVSVKLESFDDTRGNRIDQYVISDNGCGMDEQGLIDAFTLGTDREYRPGSLGKFGLGLKSAGLSLGEEVALVSKTESSSLQCAILDQAAVRKSGDYEISLGECPDEFRELWEAYSVPHTSGTMLVIRRTADSSPVANSFADYLTRLLGTTYHCFMQDPERLLEIKVGNHDVEAFDPLFLADAESHGSLEPSSWDGKHPRLLLEPTNLPLRGVANCNVAMTHLVHPNSFGMEAKTVSEFDQAANDARDRWRINPEQYNRRHRHGFYVYRNNRVISHADRFWGMVPAREPHWTFRGSLKFDETADDVLALDVKKRRVALPEEARKHLKDLVDLRKGKSANAMNRRGKLAQAYRREIADAEEDDLTQTSIKESPATNLKHDYSGLSELVTEAEAGERKRRQKELGDKAATLIQDPEVTVEKLEGDISRGGAVTTAQGLKANRLWLPYPSDKLGAVETIVNAAHSWVSEAYRVADEDPRLKLILNQLFTIVSRAELEVLSGAGWKDLSEVDRSRTMERFHRVASFVAEDLAETLPGAVKKIDAAPDEDFDESE